MFQNTIFSVECARRGDRTRFAKKAFRKEKRAFETPRGGGKNRTILLKYTNSNGRVPSFRLLFFKPALYFYKVTLYAVRACNENTAHGYRSRKCGSGFGVVFSLVRVSGCRGGARARVCFFYVGIFF
jgi:hypothetical protein